MRKERFFGWLIDHRLWVVAAGLLLCAVSLHLGRRVRTDYAVEQFFPIWDPERVTYERYKSVFPKEDAQFSFFFENDRPAGIELYRTLGEVAEIFADAGLDKVRWFGNVEIADSQVVDGVSEMTIHELVDAENPTTESVRNALERYRDDPLYRNFVWNESQDVFAVIGAIPPDQNHDLERRRVEGELSERLARLDGNGRRVSLTGIPYVRSRGLKILGAELGVLLGAAIVVLFAVMYLFLRRVGEIVLCVAAIVPAYLVSRGVMGLVDWPVTLLTSFLPIVVLAIGFSDTIHILTHYRVIRADGVANREAIVRAFSELAGPCFFTSLTTAIGFLALVSTRIEIVVDFAVVMGLAILLTYLAAIVFLPVLLSFGSRADSGKGAVLAGWMDGFIRFAARLGRRRSVPIVATAALLAALFGWFARELHVNANMFDLLKRGHPVMQDARWIEEQGFGLFQVNLFLEGTEAEPIHGVEMLRWLEQFRAFVEHDPLVVTTGSFIDQLKQVRRAVLDGREEEYRLPDSTPEAEQLLLLADSSDTAYLEDVYVQASQEGQFVIVVQDRGSKVTLPFIDRVERYIAEHPPPAGVEATPTGTVKLAQKAYARLTEGFAWSLLIAIGLIFALMVLIFRSFAWGAVALVPNLLPLILLFGLFALLDFSVKPTLAIVFAISFGIAVDDTIHMLSELNRLRSEGRTGEALVEGAMHTSGRAIVITTLVIGSGFAILMLSEFEWIGLLGLLTPVALLGALLADLFVLPALIHLFRLAES